ncbi:hypothetical protein C8A05DRAFT_12655 [Staphylotrichum tortipilum]|uniref:RRM domain-containing protein n=1 Tax=Staphylotrichum tortipilum TaxID=2831512 RepID=A0AAN6MR39_9PEZI|nr:hypothetical protein C8A05DRAFT_12655 [Staphylotrichum longicolle]
MPAAAGYPGQNAGKNQHTKHRFSAFVEADDWSDEDDDAGNAGGGVLLRDFEDHNYAAHSATPMGKASSNGGGSATVPRQGHVGLSLGTSGPSGRRNTIAPIGTGRYDAAITNANAGNGATAALNASVDGEAPTLSQASPEQNLRFGFAQSLNVVVNSTMPTTHGLTPRQAQPANNTKGFPWGTTPVVHNTQATTLKTPQAMEYFGNLGSGTALGANLPFINSTTTPSHIPNKMTSTTTVGGLQTPSFTGQYNQTEPRNFAPRIGGIPSLVSPPPTFNVGYQPDATQHEESKFAAPDFDPFLSPRHRRVPASNNLAALILRSVPEENDQTLNSRLALHGPVPAEVRATRSAELNALTDGPMGLPTQETALDPDNFPFMESTTQAAPVSHGVIKLRNIPFGTKRAEIIAFLGRNSKILNDVQEPVHIIMERVSSKTQDCYVEFGSTQDAVRAVERHRDNVHRGRPARLGDRPVEVLLSSQAALMQDLFPLASGIWWDNGKPVIQTPIDGQPWKTFKGFVTEEEMTMLVKHVELPQRSPYSKECPQRPYECMISTIKKLPWYMADHITLRQRYAVYDTTINLVRLLKQTLQRDNRFHETTLNPQLLKRLVTAAMLCPGFTVLQKDNIAVVSEMDQEQARMFNQPRFPEEWVHLHGICPKPGMPIDVLEWYISLIREETTRYVHGRHIVERNEIQRTGHYTSLYFGYIWYEIGLPRGKELDNLSLHDLALREMEIIERIISRAIPSAPGLFGWN